MTRIIAFALALFFVSCSASKRAKTIDDAQLTVTFVQINDVYEIAPLSGGREGGLARVATLKKQQIQKNPNTVMVMAGDFLSPSVYNSLKYEGERIRGRQMVDVLNTAGLDIAVFGNHEFDIAEAELQSRLNESQFDWVSSNSFHRTPHEIRAFQKVRNSQTAPIPPYRFLDFKDADGTTARLGILGLNIPFNQAPYVFYTDVLQTADSLYTHIKDSCDAVVAITHLSVEEDSILATRLPNLALIMGGHEHDMRFLKVGDVYITKAHANARSAFVIDLLIGKQSGITVTPHLVHIDTTLQLDSATSQTVQKWVDIANANYAALGFDAAGVVMRTGEPLDGREESVRTSATNLTRLLIAAMEEAAPHADVVLFNSGSIRVDDMLPMPVTQYDIIRALPYGGYLTEVDMTGGLLVQVLKAGQNNLGNGGFLQYSPQLVYDGEDWTLDGAVIDSTQSYRVAISDFLLTGGEANMEFLNRDNPAILQVYPKPAADDLRRDIRLLLIDYLQKQKQ